MLRPFSFLSLPVLCILTSAIVVIAVGQSAAAADPFALDGTKNIVEEAHFGIVNGKLTSSIPYRNALAVKGLWAPPYVSSDFSLGISLMDRLVTTERFTWHPFHVDRTGSVQEITVESITMLVPGTRGGLVAVTLKNTTAEPKTVPVAIDAGGTLDQSMWWEFGTPGSKTATTQKATDGAFSLKQGDQAIVLRASDPIRWEQGQPCGRGTVLLSPSGTAKLYVAFAIGQTEEANAACARIVGDPEKAMADTRIAYAQQVKNLFQAIPRLTSSSPALERLYNRSLVHLVTNRWDVPEFVLHPYYSTGSVNGGCLAEYLWNFGENWEIFPLFDPDASRTHIKQFLASDMTTHFAFEPTTGKAWGPWYMINQEKIIGLIYYHVKNTGDVAFLNDVVNGKTVLEHAFVNAMYGDDPTKPVAMIDYGPSNSHLELRRGIPYNHAMPDLNGRRYQNYVLAAELADVAGDIKTATQLRKRAEELKTVLKNTLWNKDTRWFDFVNEKGEKDTRYTVQMFKLFGSKVLDAEQEAGLLAHLNSEKEFLSEFGLHSMSKTDVAYDPADVDNGGPGACTCFPPQIVERLYRAGKPQAAENVLQRILWWGERMPYWGDSIVAERIDYRKDTPLQCTIDGASVAQCIIFGMFGVRAEFDGSIRIDPHPPTFAAKLELKGIKLRGHVLDITVDGATYEVREGANKLDSPIGRPILVRDGRLLQGEPQQR